MPKNCHMQGSANQVKNCTTASCFIVVGISASDEAISANPPKQPLFSARKRRNASISSGGYSFVVSTVQSTAARKTIAPILNEYSTESGMPVAITPTTPSAVNT